MLNALVKAVNTQSIVDDGNEEGSVTDRRTEPEAGDHELSHDSPAGWVT